MERMQTSLQDNRAHIVTTPSSITSPSKNKKWAIVNYILGKLINKFLHHQYYSCHHYTIQRVEETKGNYCSKTTATQRRARQDPTSQHQCFCTNYHIRAETQPIRRPWQDGRQFWKNQDISLPSFNSNNKTQRESLGHKVEVVVHIEIARYFILCLPWPPNLCKKG